MPNHKDNHKDDTFDRMYIGKSGCMVFIIVIAIIYVIYNIISNS
jgi:hypothetical protein